MSRQIDQLGGGASAELHADTVTLVEETEKKSLNEKGRAYVRAHYREILSGFDEKKLQRIISKLYTNKSTEQIQQHASHDLVAQLCLDFLGFDHTQVDSKIGPQSKEAIVLLKGIYNRLYYRNIPLVGKVDKDFFVAAQELLQSTFVYHPKDRKTQELVAEVQKDKQLATLRYNERGMITNWKHDPQKFMREIGSKSLDPAFVGKVFYVGTIGRKDEGRRTIKPKKHLFWHGSEGNSSSTLNTLYNSGAAAYAILENGAIVCFFDEGKGTGALNGDKGLIFHDPKAHTNGIAVEFAAPGLKRTATFRTGARVKTRTYRDTVEPNQPQIQAAGLLVDYLQKKQGVRLNIGTSGAGWAVGSSDHGDTLGRSDEVLRQLRVDQQHISWINTKVTPTHL